MAERKQYTDAELTALSKKDLILYLKENGSNAFLRKFKLSGSVPNITKAQPKPALETAYKELWAR